MQNAFNQCSVQKVLKTCFQGSASLLLCFHRIIESQNGLGWKGPYRSPSSNPPAMGRDPFHQPRVLRAPSNLALNTAREGAATASLGSLGQGLTTLLGKNFCLTSNIFSTLLCLYLQPNSLSLIYTKAFREQKVVEPLHPDVHCILVVVNRHICSSFRKSSAGTVRASWC